MYPTLTEDFKGSIGLPVERDPANEVATQTGNVKFKISEIGGIPEGK